MVQELPQAGINIYPEPQWVTEFVRISIAQLGKRAARNLHGVGYVRGIVHACLLLTREHHPELTPEQLGAISTGLNELYKSAVLAAFEKGNDGT